MPYFEYDAVSPDAFHNMRNAKRFIKNQELLVNELYDLTKLKDGVISADNPEDAVRKLNELGLIPVRMSLILGNSNGLARLEWLKQKVHRTQIPKNKPLPRGIKFKPHHAAIIVGIILIVLIIISSLNK